MFKLSSLSEFSRQVELNGFAIKYVVEGHERYTIDRSQYVIEQGGYLLLNGKRDAHIEIESKKNVKGICIDISTELIADAVASVIEPGTPYSDAELGRFFYTEQFLDHQYAAGS